MSGDGTFDPLANCPRCLQPRSLTGAGERLFWICACSATPVDCD